MRGFYMAHATNKSDVALEYYAYVLTVLEWGEQTCRNVSTEDKGSIFLPAFRIGVERLSLEAMMSKCTEGRRSKSFLDEIHEKAQDLSKEMDRLPS